MRNLGVLVLVVCLAPYWGCKKKRQEESEGKDAVVVDAATSEDTASQAKPPSRQASESASKPSVVRRQAKEKPQTREVETEEASRKAPPAQDIRLLLTLMDIKEIAGDKVVFVRRNLPGIVKSGNKDALYFEPQKGNGFGFSIQVFTEKVGPEARQRFDNLFATYPNATEVAAVAGRTFFAYYGDVIHIGFLHPMTGRIVVLSCGLKYCNSDKLYELAKKVATRVR